jgi:hypothetical protein
MTHPLYERMMQNFSDRALSDRPLPLPPETDRVRDPITPLPTGVLKKGVQDSMRKKLHL